MKKKLTLVLNLILVMASAILLTACAENAPRVPDDFLQVTSIESKTTENTSTSVEEPEPEVVPHVEYKISEWGYKNIIPYTENLLIAYDGEKYFFIDRNNIVLSATSFSKSENVLDSFSTNSFQGISLYLQDNCFIAYNKTENGNISSVLYNDKLVALMSAMDTNYYISDYRDGIVTLTWLEGYVSYVELESMDLVHSISVSSDSAIYTSPVSYGQVVELYSRYIDKFPEDDTEINNYSWLVDLKEDSILNKSYTYDSNAIIFGQNAINKEGWTSVCLGITYEDGSFGAYVENNILTSGGFFNVKTGEFVSAPSIGMSKFVVEENGCNQCTVIDHYAALPMSIDENGSIQYRIYDIEKGNFVDDNLYSDVTLRRKNSSIAYKTNGKAVYLSENMTPASIECDYVTTFVGELAMITINGKTYIINKDFDVVSDEIECDGYMAANSCYEFSPDFREGTFIVLVGDTCHLLECNYIK